MLPVIPSLILALIPISFILGTLAININIALIGIIAIKAFIQNRDKFKVNVTDKFILILFLYILINGIVNSLEYILFKEGYFVDFTVIIKSFSYLRFFILYISLRVLLDLNTLKFKYLYWTTTISVFFVTSDLVYQLFRGEDIFGFISPYPNKLTGPFQDEAIAGSYLQKFSIISILSLLFFWQHNRFRKFFFIIFFLCLITFGIIISGNRMPLVLFILSLVLILSNVEIIKKYSFFIITLLIILFSLTFNYNNTVNNYFKNFYKSSSSIVNLYVYRFTGVGENILYDQRPSYIHEFDNGIGTWKMNRFFGGGIKSYRYNCLYRKTIDIQERYTCNMHPHNYYLEILSDLGVFGLTYFLFIILLVLKTFLQIPKRSIEKYISYPFLFIVLIEFFPFRSSGSIFTTTNSSLIFFSIAILVSMAKKSKLKSRYD